MLLEDLQAAVSPAIALLLVGVERVGQEAVAVALVGVMRVIAKLEQGQAEIGVLADRVARPAAGGLDGRAAHQAHRAMHDDGVHFVPLHHTDIEEAGIFAVHRVMNQTAVAVAVVLRRLHEPDGGIGEQRHQIFEPVRRHDIVGVDDADDFGIGRGVHGRQAQGAGLEAFEIVGQHELEFFTEHAAMLFDRHPHARIWRVVDDDDAFEIRVVEARDGVERLLEHLRRFAIGRNVDRHFRRDEFRRQRRRVRHQPHRLATEGDRRDLLDARQRDDDQRDKQQCTETEREGRAGHEIVAVPIGEQGRRPCADGVGRGGQQNDLPDGDGARRQDRQRQQHAHQQGDAGKLPVIRIADRAGPAELGVTRRIEQAPIGADAAFEYLPRLIDGFDDVVVDAVGLGARDEFSQSDGLLDAAGIGGFQIIAGARPAELGDDDALAGIGAAQLVINDDGLIDRLGFRETFPIRQDMRGDVIDRRHQFRMFDPDVPDFAGGHRHVDRALDALDHRNEVGNLLLATVDRFVADEDAVDVAVTLRQFDHRTHFAFVALLILVDPGADRRAQAEFRGNAWDQFDAGCR